MGDLSLFVVMDRNQKIKILAWWAVACKTAPWHCGKMYIYLPKLQLLVDHSSRQFGVFDTVLEGDTTYKQAMNSVTVLNVKPLRTPHKHWFGIKHVVQLSYAYLAYMLVPHM